MKIIFKVKAEGERILVADRIGDFSDTLEASSKS